MQPVIIRDILHIRVRYPRGALYRKQQLECVKGFLSPTQTLTKGGSTRRFPRRHSRMRGSAVEQHMGKQVSSTYPNSRELSLDAQTAQALPNILGRAMVVIGSVGTEA
jgi:hypothetical protein